MKAMKLRRTRLLVFKVLTSSMLLMFIMSLSTIHNASAQTTYKSTTGELKVAGTSNVHDWEMKTQSSTVSGQFIFTDGILQELKSLDFDLLVNNLKSKDKQMDSRAYKTLKADQYNKITYKLTSAEVSSQQKDQYLIRSEGKLTISGVTVTIPMNVRCTVNPDGSIQIVGTRKMKMSDFKIPPPSFMLGALKTGDNLTIDFNIKLVK
jgi:polyisoprenoid-binding protein YceI